MSEQAAAPYPVLMPVYDRADLWFERGEGVWLYDEKGDRYLDCVGGVAVTSLGHANPRLAHALYEQAKKLWTVSNIFHTRAAEKLAQRLVDLSFADTVFFQNSGVEAWECGIKVIRKHFSAVGKPERHRVITFEGCFHGRSMTAIAASKAEKMVKGFGPLLDGFDVVPWGDLDAVRTAITDQTAAVCIEPVLGEGGVKVIAPSFLCGLRDLCDEKGLLLYYDEIQCGLGRTGKMFAYEASGITPDVMCIAKALGNGYPIGVCLATAHAAQGMTPGTHGSTFGGNPLAAAVGNEVLNIMTEPDFLIGVARKGEYLAARLDALVGHYPNVYAERRGVGLMQGLQCVPPFAKVVTALREARLLTIGAGDNVVRMLPPLIITETEIDEAVAILGNVAAAITGA
jgi:acetylornithine/N-succinyldiaminopimelate aminotransferase